MATQKKTHTPDGFRIDLSTGDRFFMLSNGGEIRNDATQCEMELWKLNQELTKALEAAESWICNTPGKTEYMTKEKFKVAEQIRKALAGESS